MKEVMMLKLVVSNEDIIRRDRREVPSSRLLNNFIELMEEDVTESLQELQLCTTEKEADEAYKKYMKYVNDLERTKYELYRSQNIKEVA